LFAVAALAVFAACAKAPSEKEVNILVNQDRWGEVAPTG